MKKVEAIIRPERLEDVKDALAAINVRGISITQIVGCGVQKGWTEIYRGNEYQLNFRAKVKIEIVTVNDRLEEVLDVIINSARTGEIGDGKIFVSDITDVVRIRTGERGKTAL